MTRLNSACDEAIVTFNGHRFDLPYLIRRCWKLGVKISNTIQGPFRTPRFIDLYEQWQCFDRQESISLDKLSGFLGVGEKSGSGKDFAALFASDRSAALAYLANDLKLTADCYHKMNPSALDEAGFQY
jgi:hypothetical protein